MNIRKFNRVLQNIDVMYAYKQIVDGRVLKQFNEFDLLQKKKMAQSLKTTVKTVYSM